MIVFYHTVRRSKDVLDLISKVLAFNDDQLIIVGLKVPPTDVFTSLLSSIITPPPPPPVNIEVVNYSHSFIVYIKQSALKL